MEHTLVCASRSSIMMVLGPAPDDTLARIPCCLHTHARQNEGEGGGVSTHCDHIGHGKLHGRTWMVAML